MVNETDKIENIIAVKGTRTPGNNMGMSNSITRFAPERLEDAPKCAFGEPDTSKNVFEGEMLSFVKVDW